MGPFLLFEYLPKLIVFVRHGESTGNTYKGDAGDLVEVSYFYDLTSRGREQVRVTGEWISPRYGFDHWISSTQKRAIRTMELLFPDRSPGFFFQDPRLDEWDRGIFHNTSQDDRYMYYPREQVAFDKIGPYHYRPPQGESMKDVVVRMLDFLTSISLLQMRNPRHVSLCISGHGRYLTALQCILMRLPDHEIWNMAKQYPIPNGSVTEFRLEMSGYRPTDLPYMEVRRFLPNPDGSAPLIYSSVEEDQNNIVFLDKAEW